MGILLVYDVTDESSFNNIRLWIKNIEQNASDNVNKLLIGNKCDMSDKKVATQSIPLTRMRGLSRLIALAGLIGMALSTSLQWLGTVRRWLIRGGDKS